MMTSIIQVVMGVALVERVAPVSMLLDIEILEEVICIQDRERRLRVPSPTFLETLQFFVWFCKFVNNYKLKMIVHLNY